jgi:hypothetical protein
VNWEALGAIGDALGALGVIVSLVYLAKQIRVSAAQTEANSKIIRGTAYQQFRMQVNAVVALRVTDAELALIWDKGLSDYDSLNESEQSRFSSMIFLVVGNWESQHHLTEVGIFDESMGANRHGLVSRPGFKRWWELRRGQYSPGFRAEIERSMQPDGCA